MRQLLSLLAVLSSMYINAQARSNERLLISVIEDKTDQAVPIDTLFVNGRANFKSQAAQNIFKGKNIAGFTRAYPGIEKYSHPNAKILARYYYVDGDFDKKQMRDEVLQNGSEFYKTAEIITRQKIPLYIPDDYNDIPGFTTDHTVLDNIKATQAWDITKGNSSIKIAIDDPYGFYLDHPDYIMANGSSKISYIDASANNISWEVKISNPSTGFVGYGPNSHGLSVATTAAGATDNGEGVSAIGYNSSLMLFDSGPGDWYDLSYNHGADVIVASYRSSCNPISSDQLEIDMVYDNGTVIVCAAGNGTKGAHCDSSDGENNGSVYPASYDNVISVGGVTSEDFYFDSATGHLTFNSKVDLTAPGWEVPAAARRFSTNLNDEYLPNWNGYTPFKGTSAAAPLVGGVAALILSLNSNITPLEVENIMRNTALNIDNLVNPNYPDNSVFAGLAGAGRIDAYEAVKLAQRCFTDQNLVVTNYPQSFGSNPPKIVTKRVLNIDGITLQTASNYEFYVDRAITFEPGFKAPLGTTLKVDICEDCKSLGNE
jgi:subtilisin family serine protease